MPRRLLASIHDVGPRSEGAFDRLHALFAAEGLARPALLVVPDYWGEAPIRPGTPFATRLRGLSDEGHEIFLHGWLHRDDSGQGGFKARHMTAGEGEFLALDAAEAARRIIAGRLLLEDIIGRPLTGFVAPAWLYGEGAHQALRTTAMPLAENHWRVWNPVTGAVLAKSPVITWASRTPLRRWSSLGVDAAARTLPLPTTMRLAVHPGDVTSPALIASITATLRSLLKTHAPARYADLQS
ncbi:MAG: DUF2334 domain-containing protein [Sphingomicrobium sp.]